MSWSQVPARKETIIGNTDVSRITYPSIRGSIRRNDPDGDSTEPYFPSLSGTTLVVDIAGTTTATYTINFVTDSYADTIALITAAAPTHIKAEDDNGYLRISNVHAGNRNKLTITSGDAAPILGFDISPLIGATSYAGEIASSSTGWPNQNLAQGTNLIANDEGLNSRNLNRAYAAGLTVNDSILADLDKELCFPKRFSGTLSGSSFTLPGTERLFINANGVVIPNPTADTLDDFITLLDSNDNQVFDSTGNRVRVTSITYGTLVSTASSFTSWGTHDGKSVFGTSSHWQKVKSTSTITNIKGNIVYCSGATFITDKVQVNDTIQITGATNLTPFSHNGEFIIDGVLTEEYLAIRPKGSGDTTFVDTHKPSSLNPSKQISESFGTLNVILGYYVPLTLKDGDMTFNLSASLSSGTYRVILPIGKTLRNLLTEDFTLSQITTPFGGQIELGSKFLSSTGALKARITATPYDAGSGTQYTLVLESRPADGTSIVGRVYSLNTGGLIITNNAKWDGTNWNKDVTGIGASFSVHDQNGLIVKKRADASNTAWTDSDWISVINMPGADTAAGDALIPRLKPVVTTTGSPAYTLIEEVGPSGARTARRYISSAGAMVNTINSSWDGTNWTPDDILYTMIKYQIDQLDTKVYTHTGSAGSFTDTAWENQKVPVSLFNIDGTLFRDTQYLFHEDFDGAVDSVSSINLCKFWVTGSNNIKMQTWGTQNAQGAVQVMRNGNSGPGGLYCGFMSQGRNDNWVMRFRVQLIDKANIANETTARYGFWVGNYDQGGNERFTMFATHGNANWKVYLRGDQSSIDTGVAASNGVWYDIEFQKYSNTMYAKINGSIVGTMANHNFDFYGSLSPFIGLDQTGGTSLAGVDYVTLFSNRLNT